MTAAPLLDFIAEKESGGDYNIVWGRIKKEDRPPKPLTRMTIGEVLDWQDSIDPHYLSEAAGRYQILEDTLRGLYRSAGLGLDDYFNEANQDALAIALMRRRGYTDWLSGKISTTKFANNLAKEWASLPVVSGPKAGRSYYDNDVAGNKSLVSVKAFLKALESVKSKPAFRSPWAALLNLILSIFRRK